MGSAQTAAELARRVAELTGDLSASPDRLEDLDRARRLIARSGLSTPAPTALRTAPAATPTGEMRLIAIEALDAMEEEAPRTRVVRRESPARPAGATETLGPFLTPERRRVWFDVFEEAVFSPTRVAAWPRVVPGVYRRDHLRRRFGV